MNQIKHMLTWCIAGLLIGSAWAQTADGVPASSYETKLRRFLADAPVPGTGASTGDFIVALVNSDIVTQQEIKTRLDKQMKAVPGAKIEAGQWQEVLYRLIDEIVAERLYLQAAKQAGITVDAGTVDNAIASIAKQNDLSVAQLKERLKDEGLTYDEFRSRISTQLLSQRVRDRFSDSRPVIADRLIEAELAKYVNATVPPKLQLNLAHLLIGVPETATPEQEKAAWALAQDLVKRAQAGTPFVDLAAIAQNKAPSSDAKGMGLKDNDRYPTLFVDAVANLAVGGVSAPTRSGAGFHVLKVLEKSESAVPLVAVTETRARHVLIRAELPAEIDAATSSLAALRQDIVLGKTTFADAAKKVSQDGSAQAGGDLGWTSPAQFVPEFEKVMMQLPLGQVSMPVVSRFGVHLIEVVERREARLPRNVLRDRVLGQLREAKAQESFKTMNQELRDRAYIEWREVPRL